MNILDKIVAFKKQEVEQLKRDVPLEKLVKSPQMKRECLSLKLALAQKRSSGIIAEYKRQSPSKGVINDRDSVQAVTEGYLKAGIAAQSVLTDLKFFGGTVVDILHARKMNDRVPILRKDFIVDGFQIVEAKAIGADAILLIAACLSKSEIRKFGDLAADLGLEVLYEIHSREELDKIDPAHQVVGINNRNLKTFEVDLEHSIALANELPESTVKVSESGISDPRIITGLRQYGFQGFLIGEHFMASEDPGATCDAFIKSLDHYES
jgi:indole-3-glycerol phosphate synthase